MNSYDDDKEDLMQTDGKNSEKQLFTVQCNAIMPVSTAATAV